MIFIECEKNTFIPKASFREQLDPLPFMQSDQIHKEKWDPALTQVTAGNSNRAEQFYKLGEGKWVDQAWCKNRLPDLLENWFAFNHFSHFFHFQSFVTSMEITQKHVHTYT